MNEQAKQPEYLLIFRGTDWCHGLSPEQIQEITGRWMAWFDRLTAEGKAKAGQPLKPEGKIVSGKRGRIVSDGPFAEAKEAIGGYFLVQADSLDEAVAMARECPGLEYGALVEVRPVAEICPMAEAARQLLAEAETAHANA